MTEPQSPSSALLPMPSRVLGRTGRTVSVFCTATGG